MSTTVRIREEDKERLDRLQAKITLETGEKPSLEEVLHRLVELGEANEVDLIFEDEPPELSQARKQAILAMGSHTGTRTSEEDIDETLYGGPEGPV